MSDLEVSEDALWGGRLPFCQPARGHHGYRFNLDPVLLAGFAPVAPRVMDLGCGVGVIGLMLLALGKAEELVLVERQEKLATCARRNVATQGVAEHARVVNGDLRRLALPRVDLVVFNPPYVPVGMGRVSPHRGRDEARREVHGGFADFCAAAGRCLAGEGKMVAVVPSGRALDLVVAAGVVSMELERRWDVRARPGVVPHLALLQFAYTTAKPVEEEVRVIHTGETGRAFSPWVEVLVQGPMP